MIVLQAFSIEAMKFSIALTDSVPRVLPSTDPRVTEGLWHGAA
jgi:hypothetical protein